MTPHLPGEQSNVSGSIRLSIEVEATIALSRLTGKWTDDEKRKLIAGDEEAVEALEYAALPVALREGDADIVRTDLRITEKGNTDA